MKNILVYAISIFLLTACIQQNVGGSVQEQKPFEKKSSKEENHIEEEVVGDQDINSLGDNQTGESTEEAITEQKEPQYRVNQTNWLVQPIGDANDKVVLLTIDDAPDRYGLEMANTLHRLGVKAIFFVNGHFIDTEEEVTKLKEIHNLGFPIGNHTYSHRLLKDLTEEEQYQEIISLNKRIEEIIGEKPRFFRAPFGVNTDYSKRIASEENMVIMNWTYGYDWEADFKTKNSLTDIMVNTPLLSKGANLLMHDRKWTSEALENIVKGLQAKGYEIVDPDLIEIP